MARPPRLSGLQKQVLALYRSALRAAAPRGDAATQYVRAAFREQAAAVDKLDVQRIEFHIRQTQKRLDAMASGALSFSVMSAGGPAGGPRTPPAGAAAPAPPRPAGAG
jgi:succinate dehydrogenase assembly factor 1